MYSAFSAAPHACVCRTFECISVVLCLQPMLASPALVFASAGVVQPPASPLLIAVLREEFLPVASKRIMNLRCTNAFCFSVSCIPSHSAQSLLLASPASSPGNSTTSARPSRAFSSQPTAAVRRRPCGGNARWRALLQICATMLRSSHASPPAPPAL